MLFRSVSQSRYTVGISVSGNAIYSNQLSVNGNTIMCGKLSVQGDAEFNNVKLSNLYINGQLFDPSTQSSSASFTGNQQGDISVSNNVYIQNRLSISGHTYIRGKLSVFDDSTFKTVRADTIYLNGEQLVTPSPDFNSDVSISGILYASKDLSVSGNTYMCGAIVTGKQIGRASCRERVCHYV